MQKAKASRKSSEKPAPLKVKGSCTIEDAGRIRSLLTEQLRETDALVIDLSGVSESDLSFLQLLCAAHKSALRAKKRIALDGEMSESLIRKVREAGFACRKECGPDLNKDCLWAEV